MPQSAEEWIKLASAVVVSFLIPAYFAWKRGKLNDFLTKELEPKLTDLAKDHIKDKAIRAGVQGVLAATLKANGLAKKTPKGGTAAGLLLLALLFVPAFVGCGKSVEPYRLSVEGMADTGDDVRPLIKNPLTPGEQALVDAWDFQRQAGHKLAEGK